MTNYYIEGGFSLEELAWQKEVLEDKLRELGELYDKTANYDNLTPYQERAIELARAGYDLGEQIHDTYSEIGGIMEAEEVLEV